MKYGVLVIVLGPWSLQAMEVISNNNKSRDEIVEMDENYSKHGYLKSDYRQKENGSLDIELHEMEYPNEDSNTYLLDQENYVNNFLLKLPIFKGKKSEKIKERMEQIEKILPKEYGEIAESLSISHSGFKNRSKLNNRGFSDIDHKDVNDINAKIQYALLEVAYENQKIATKNREEDLAQAGRDRMCSRIFSVAGIIFSVPAITLGIINIIKAFN